MCVHVDRLDTTASQHTYLIFIFMFYLSAFICANSMGEPPSVLSVFYALDDFTEHGVDLWLLG